MSMLLKTAEYLEACRSSAAATGDDSAAAVLAAAHRLVLDEERRRVATAPFVERPERRSCNFKARLTSEAYQLPCRVINMSVRGLGISISTFAQLNVGDRVTLNAEVIGVVGCVLRWKGHERIGVELDLTGDAEKKIRRIFESLPS